MAVRRDDGRWRYRKIIRLPDGTKERINGTPSINTKLAAEEAERAHIERMLRPAAPPEPTREEVPTFDEFADEFMRTYVAANNKPSERIAKDSMLRTNVRPAFGRMKLDAITLREIEAFKAKLLADGLTAKTVNNNLTVLGRVLRYAHEIGILDAPPRVKFLRVAPAKFDLLDFDEFDRLVEAARAEPDVRAAILAAGEAGLRAGEVRALEWDDLDLKAGRLTVQRTEYRGHVGSPKGGRARIVPLTQRLRDAFREARHLRGSPVFPDASGARWTRGEQDARLWRACRKAGLRRIGWHVLRHTFCSHLAMRGAPVKAIQELAGHASITTTMRYLHLAPGFTRDAIRLLESRPRGNHVTTADLTQEQTGAATGS